MTLDVIHQLIYGLSPRRFESGQIILRDGDNPESIYFVESGSVEFYLMIDNTEFVFETLHPGSVINHRNFILGDQMEVNLRCKQNCRLLELTQGFVTNVMMNHPSFSKHMQLTEFYFLQSLKHHPIDMVKIVPVLMIPR